MSPCLKMEIYLDSNIKSLRFKKKLGAFRDYGDLFLCFCHRHSHTHVSYKHICLIYETGNKKHGWNKNIRCVHKYLEEILHSKCKILKGHVQH